MRMRNGDKSVPWVAAGEHYVMEREQRTRKRCVKIYWQPSGLAVEVAGGGDGGTGFVEDGENEAAIERRFLPSAGKFDVLS